MAISIYFQLGQAIKETKMIATKGTKLFCGHCDDHILTLSATVHPGHYFGSQYIDQAQGQAPWRFGERMDCRKCGDSYFNGTLKGRIEYAKSESTTGERAE